jgi:hypothetical protein
MEYFTGVAEETTRRIGAAPGQREALMESELIDIMGVILSGRERRLKCGFPVWNSLRGTDGGDDELQIRHIQEIAQWQHTLDHHRGRIGGSEESNGALGGNLWRRIFRVFAGRGNCGGVESELPAPGRSRLIGQRDGWSGVESGRF